jgi:2-amino-4-hydroxy-6-hydroxymethyldihydropteridine diphosphokinase
MDDGKMNNIVYISLGSNLGVREKYLEDAISLLIKSGHITVTGFSSIYETDPIGYEDQQCFLNMVIEASTDLEAEDLLKLCLLTEKQLGRERVIRWGPRTADLDILLYNKENIKTEHLTIPHPRMNERAFVLIPLNEINPTLAVPEIGVTIQKLTESVRNKGVRLWKRKIGEDVFELFEN